MGGSSVSRSVITPLKRSPRSCVRSIHRPSRPSTAWGRGTLKMAELALSAGLPRPEIEDAAGYVTVRFRPTRYVPPERVAKRLTERQRLILTLLAASPGGLALREIRAGLGGQPAEWEV